MIADESISLRLPKIIRFDQFSKLCTPDIELLAQSVASLAQINSEMALRYAWFYCSKHLDNVLRDAFSTFLIEAALHGTLEALKDARVVDQHIDSMRVDLAKLLASFASGRRKRGKRLGVKTGGKPPIEHDFSLLNEYEKKLDAVRRAKSKYRTAERTGTLDRIENELIELIPKKYIPALRPSRKTPPKDIALHWLKEERDLKSTKTLSDNLGKLRQAQKTQAAINNLLNAIQSNENK